MEQFRKQKNQVWINKEGWRVVTICTSRHRESLWRVVTFISCPRDATFLNLNSFHILVITPSTDIQFRWFKLVWKDNRIFYNLWRNFLKIKLFQWTKLNWNLQILPRGVTFDAKWCLSKFNPILDTSSSFQSSIYTSFLVWRKREESKKRDIIKGLLLF